MYAVIIYDVGVERLNSVRHILKQYLIWLRNSAFEGEITLGKLEDSIHFYRNSQDHQGVAKGISPNIFIRASEPFFFTWS